MDACGCNKATCQECSERMEINIPQFLKRQPPITIEVSGEAMTEIKRRELEAERDELHFKYEGFRAARDGMRIHLEARLAHCWKERDKLKAFKRYVHERLDAAGIPTHPDGPHSKEGCRVGDRLDLLIGKRDELEAVLEQRNRMCSNYFAQVEKLESELAEWQKTSNHNPWLEECIALRAEKAAMRDRVAQLEWALDMQPDGLDCTICDNSGGYATPDGESGYCAERCDWCWEFPYSKFNVARKKADAVRALE